MKHSFQLSKFPYAIQLLVLIILFFVGSMLQGLVLTLLGITNIQASSSAQILSAMTATQLLGFLFPALIFIRLLPRPIEEFLLFKKIDRTTDILLLVVLTIATLISVIGVSQSIFQLPLGSFADQMQEERKSMENTALQMEYWYQIPLRLLIMALLPAVCEELFFRGVLQRFMYTFLKLPILAVLATGLIFALFHGSIYNFLPITIAGIVLGLVYFYSGNIWYSIILHFLVNGLQVVFTFFQDGSVTETISLTYSLVLMLAGIATIVFTLQRIRKGKTTDKASWVLPYEPMFK